MRTTHFDQWNAQASIPSLAQNLEDVVAIMTEVMDRTPLPLNSCYSKVCFAYLSKQRSHSEAIHALIGHRDGMLIARSMMEGLCNLLYIASEPETRAKAWMEFVVIEDWRRMNQNRSLGYEIDPDEESKINANFATHSFQFKDKSSRDGYMMYWCGMGPRQLFRKVEGELLFPIYSIFSEYHHWSPSGLFRPIESKNEELSYDSNSATDTASSLNVAFQAVWQSLQVADECFTLGLEHNLNALKSRVFAQFGINEAMTIQEMKRVRRIPILN